MSKLLLFILLLAFSCRCFCQQQLTSEHYMTRAKNQKTTGLVLGIGGTTLFMLGGGHSIGEAFSNSDGNINASDLIFVIGGAAMLASIPFFIASKRNKKKGISLGMKPMMAPHQNNIGNARSFIPAISVKLQL